jgi:hypothetical protein
MINEDDIIIHHPSWGARRYGDLNTEQKEQYRKLITKNDYKNQIKIGLEIIL